MRKISDNLENQIIEMTKNNDTAHKIAKILGICHRSVLQVRKRRNVDAPEVQKSRPRLVTNRDARAMEHLMMTKQLSTPKEAAAALNIPVSEWTARRALQRIGLISAVNQEKPALPAQNVSARHKFSKEHKS